MFKHYNEELFLAHMFVLTIAIFNGMTAIFFITADPRISSPTYEKMQELMSLDAYGLIMLASSVFLILSIFQIGKIKNLSMIAGGLLGTISIGLYASASTQGAVNMMLPSRYSLIACACLLLAIVGGFSLWQQTKKNT